MDPSIEHIVFYDDLSAEQTGELRRIVAIDPEAEALLLRWRAVRTELARALNTDMVDREVFLLYVLSRHGRSRSLSPAERDRVEEAAPEIEKALRRRSSLSIIAKQVRSDVEAFEAIWSDWFDDTDATKGDGRSASPRRAVRRARPAVARRSGARRWVVRAGIGVTFAVFAALLILVGQREFASETITTAPGEVHVVEIGGGSVVRMLGDSRLTYVPPGRGFLVDRQAAFEGRGFFDIAPAARGFVLKTPNAQAVVLGTSFGVQADENVTEVVLSQGSLSLASRQTPDRVVVLSSGQLSRVAASQLPSDPVDVRVHDRLAWTGLFVFRATTVRDILT
ncbi:MAG: FecR family protein, partial [Rhodothermales bacterium]